MCSIIGVYSWLGAAMWGVSMQQRGSSCRLDEEPAWAGLRNADRFREGMNTNGRCFHVAAILGMSESPMPGRSGAMTVNFSLSLSISVDNALVMDKRPVPMLYNTAE